MGIIKTTAYPMRYAAQSMQPQLRPNAEDSKSSPQFSFGAIRCIDAERKFGSEEHTGDQCEQSTRQYTDMMFVQFSVTPNGNPRRMQKDIAMRIASTLGVKCMYHEPEAPGDNILTICNHGGYTVAGWHITDYNITSNWFALDELPQILRVMEVLSSFKPDGEIRINYQPERYDLPMLMNVSTIMEARRPLIEEALGLTDELKIVVTQYLTFSFKLDVFHMPAIEACACLLRQAARMGIATKKARMKPWEQTDMSNPKFQMRSWLLRLGFIGEQFERPRRTLVDGLEGNGAFFDEASRKKAADMRRRKKALALVAEARAQIVSADNNGKDTSTTSDSEIMTQGIADFRHKARRVYRIRRR